MDRTLKVVVVGGGTGQSIILRGMKNIENIDLTTIVTVADDGGSTGRLRKQFHIPAMGDIRNVLIALAESESLLSTLMGYRFETEEDSDINGHNLGNLILTAMTQTCGSFMDSIATLSKVLNVKGNIIPATTQIITLFALMADGTIVRGEANIPDINNRIERVFYQEEVSASTQAVEAIEKADLIILGIGSLYTSILPNVIIPQIKEALRQSKAKIYYVCNAMSQPGETDGYALEDHVEALRDHGARVDCVIQASNSIPDTLLERYKNEGSLKVVRRSEFHDYEIKEFDLLDFSNQLIRHDSDKIKKTFETIIAEMRDQ